MTGHEVRVVSIAGEHGRTGFVAVCNLDHWHAHRGQEPCKWAGSTRHTRPAAEADAQQHADTAGTPALFDLGVQS